MKKDRKEKILLLSLLTILTLTGCENSNEKIEAVEKATNIDKEKIEKIITTEMIKESSDEEIVEYFTQKELELQEKEEVKEEIIEHTKTAVDFIYNDKPLNGIYFSDLKEEAKLEILESVSVTNEILEKTGIKEITIIEGTKIIKYSTEKIKEGIEISKIVLKELLSEEIYDKAGEIKEEAEERINNAIDEVKKYLKNNK